MGDRIYAEISGSTTHGLRFYEINRVFGYGGARRYGFHERSVIAATALTALPELLRAFDEYRMVAYSLLLVLVMIFKPSGLMGSYDFSLSHFLEKLVPQQQGKGKNPSGKEGAGV